MSISINFTATHKKNEVEWTVDKADACPCIGQHVFVPEFGAPMKVVSVEWAASMKIVAVDLK